MRRTNQLLPLIFICFAAAAAAPARQQTSIVDTKHNLSLSGPGPYKSTAETRICIFCHTPHGARSDAPLWNRNDSTETYLTYASTTFGGTAEQPSGASKLCLSCHDGSIALGSVLSLNAEIPMTANYRYLDSGPAFIGTSLIDDHPISFDYANSKGGTDPEYLPPQSIQPPVSLDPGGDVQCTSCHDPHNDFFGDFLRTSDRFSALCLSCHIPGNWLQASHSTSAATWDGAGTDPWPGAKYGTVAENACTSCHRSHGAAQPQRLLSFANEEDSCLGCHTGHVATKDLQSDISKSSAHDPYLTSGLHDPTENPLLMARHAECQDCHNPHAAMAGTVPPPGVPGPLIGASGLSDSGQPVAEISRGFELCYKCHADNNGGVAYVPRQIQQLNTRLEFKQGNPSYHPVEAPGQNPDVPSLLPPLTTGSLITCTDCHASDSSPTFGGSGPAGPHGSIFRPLLGAKYNVLGGVPETPAEYALCYTCHSRTVLLSNSSGFDKHEEHVVEEQISCAACHDPHGISSAQGGGSSNTHLINFDISQVSPSSMMGLIQFTDLGFRKGSCTLMCHGEDHKNKMY